MTSRLDTLVDALESQAERTWQQLEEARSRVRALEAENRSLRARLEAFDSAATQSALMGKTAESTSPHGVSVPEENDANNAAAAPDQEVIGTEDSQPTSVNGEEEASLKMRAPDKENASDRVETAPSAAGHDSEAAPSPQALLKQWYQRYPQTFFKGHTRPLQVGIHEQLAAHEPWPDKLIKRALAGYVNLPRYLKSVRVGALRVDLEGRDTEPVTEVDAAHAREQLKLLQARQREREAQKTSQRMAHKLSELASKHSH